MIAFAEPKRIKPPVERDYLSYSAIRLFQTCPLKFYFRYVMGLPDERVSSSLVLGSAVHRAIELHFRELLSGNLAPSSSRLYDELCAEWNSRDIEQVRFAKGENRESLDALGLRILLAFEKSDAARPAGRILGVEEELRGRIVSGCPDILGRVDLIVETDDALVVSDWKTSKKRWSAAQTQDAAEQLILYAELATDFAPGKPVKLEFVVMTKAKEPVVERHMLPVVPQVTRTEKRVVEQVWQAIDGKHFYPAPSAMNCPSCPYRKECRAWKG